MKKMSDEIVSNYGVTTLDSCGAYAIFQCDECNKTWEEAVETLAWFNSREGFEDTE